MRTNARTRGRSITRAAAINAARTASPAADANSREDEVLPAGEEQPQALAGTLIVRAEDAGNESAALQEGQQRQVTSRDLVLYSKGQGGPNPQ
jgi:hypothetical protein